jgi:hypothetical protein
VSFLLSAKQKRFLGMTLLTLGGKNSSLITLLEVVLSLLLTVPWKPILSLLWGNVSLIAWQRNLQGSAGWLTWVV